MINFKNHPLSGHAIFSIVTTSDDFFLQFILPLVTFQVEMRSFAGCRAAMECLPLLTFDSSSGAIRFPSMVLNGPLCESKPSFTP